MSLFKRELGQHTSTIQEQENIPLKVMQKCIHIFVHFVCNIAKTLAIAQGRAGHVLPWLLPATLLLRTQVDYERDTNSNVLSSTAATQVLALA